MGIIFNIQNSQLLTLALPTEELFQLHSQDQHVANLSVLDSHPQPQEMPLLKPLNTEFLVFLSVFWFSFPCRKV